MNTYTKAMHPKKEAHRTSRNHLYHNPAMVMIILTLVTMTALAVYIANRPVVAAENNLPVPYSNALEMQYAQPWLKAQNKPVVEYSNALEMQYAQPWLDKAELTIAVTDHGQERIPLNCSSSIEMLYACKSGYHQP